MLHAKKCMLMSLLNIKNGANLSRVWHRVERALEQVDSYKVLEIM